MNDDRRWLRPLGILAAVLGVLVSSPAGAQSAPAVTPAPILAHYYIWFNASSWDRAKIDVPAIGRYSSDEESVMREQVRLAKQSGIDGFIVSWKHTPVLDARLTKLVHISEQEGFKLAITYEGLNFDRDPLPAAQVAEGLDWFADGLASSPVFDLFEKPVVIWTGTDQMTTDDLERVTAPRRGRLRLLASAKNTDDYLRVARAFDGNAYYWSSVDPGRDLGHLKKLKAMGEAVHSQHGLWWAPAAPGFDARLVGGERVIDRKDGDTLRVELAAAAQSSPNAIAIISWNEFSENTHIEPSQRYGTTALKVLRDLAGAKAPDSLDFESDNNTGPRSVKNFVPLVGFAALLLGSIYFIYRHNRGRRPLLKEEEHG